MYRVCQYMNVRVNEHDTSFQMTRRSRYEMKKTLLNENATSFLENHLSKVSNIMEVRVTHISLK